MRKTLDKISFHKYIDKCFINIEGGGSDEEPEAEMSGEDSDEDNLNDETNTEFSTLLAVVKSSGIQLFYLGLGLLIRLVLIVSLYMF